MYKPQIDQWDTNGKVNIILEKGEKKKGFVLILMQE